MLATLLIAVTVAGELTLWLIAHLISFRPDNLLVIRFTAIMFPYVILVCGTAFLSGILQVHKRFGIPALTQTPLNIIHIAVIVIGARMLLLKPGNLDEHLQTRLAYWLSGFVLIAGVVQIAMLLPALRRIGFRFMWVGNFWTPGVKKLLKLSIPVALGASVLQISVLVDKGITLFLTAGKNPAERLQLFHHVWNYPLAIGAAARSTRRRCSTSFRWVFSRPRSRRRSSPASASMRTTKTAKSSNGSCGRGFSLRYLRVCRPAWD